MRSLLLLHLLAALCATIAVQPHYEHSSISLEKRVNDQELTNPDNEPDDEDPVTKNKTPKSRVLKVSEPKAAIDRWFDWDETCTDEVVRQRIIAAFQDSTELVQKGADFLKALKDGLPKKPPQKSATKENVAYIVQEDPAFTQIFYAQDHRIGDVENTLNTLLSKMKSFDGRNGNKLNAVRFICDVKGEIKDVDGKGYCDGGTHARTNNANVHDQVEKKYSFEKSASIVFCPPFFNDKEFPNIWDIASKDGPKTLDHVDCRERIMIHEWLHLKFTKDIGSQCEEIGFERAASVAGKKPSGKPRQADWATAKVNCDNYAWYTIYAYWNNNGGSCKQDA